MSNRSCRRLLLILFVVGLGGCQLPEHSNSPKIGASPGSRLSQSSELSPGQAAEACIVTAEKLEAGGHRRAAIGLYERARRLDADAIDFSRRLAVLYDHEGDAASAMREYHAAIANDPTNADVLNDFGYFLFTQGDLAAAETNLRSALALDQVHERAWVNLGIVLAHQARDAEAFDAFARVVGPAAAHSNLGAIMAKEGRQAEAQQAFQQALAINPALEQPQAFLAYFADRSRNSMVAPASFLETPQRQAP